MIAGRGVDLLDLVVNHNDQKRDQQILDVIHEAPSQRVQDDQLLPVEVCYCHKSTIQRVNSCREGIIRLVKGGVVAGRVVVKGQLHQQNDQQEEDRQA